MTRRRAARWGGLAVAVALGLSGVGCKRWGGGPRRSAESVRQQPDGPGQAPLPGRLEVASIRVLQVSPGTLAVSEPSEGQVRARVEEGLGRSKVLRLLEATAGTTGAYRLELQWGLVPDPADPATDPPVLLLDLSLRAPFSSGKPPLGLRLMTTLQSGPDRGRAILSAVDRVMDHLVFQAELVAAPASAVVRALGAKDPIRVAAAVEIAGHRRLREAVTPLIALLRHPAEEVRDAAIGALVAIGDRRAVLPLSESSRLEDTERLAKVLDAVAALGGREAQHFLQMVAGGHDDRDIRRMAREALERMAREAPP